MKLFHPYLINRASFFAQGSCDVRRRDHAPSVAGVVRRTAQRSCAERRRGHAAYSAEVVRKKEGHKKSVQCHLDILYAAFVFLFGLNRFTS